MLHNPWKTGNVADLVKDGIIHRFDQLVRADHPGRNAAEDENGAREAGRQAVPELRPGNHKCYQKRTYAAYGENEPAVKAVQSPGNVCDVRHFMSTPSGMCDSDHAGCGAS